MKRLTAVSLATLSLLLLSLATFGFRAAQDDAAVKASYDKTEQMLVMRDGVKLFTSIYTPKDRSRTYPIMLYRTPYSVSPYGADDFKTSLGPSPWFQTEKYIFVYQDVRGKFMSEGEFVNVRPHRTAKGPREIDESTDTFDTIEWLVKNVPNNNGRVGMWGISYPGFYVSVGMIDAHPALKAASPQAPVSDWFLGDDFHHNGAFFLPHAFNFFSSFGQPRLQPTTEFAPRFSHGTQDGYDFFLRLGPLPNADKLHLKGQVAFWNELMAHPNYDDFWKARSTMQYLKNIRPAVMTVGGWFDAENLFGALETYRAVERQSKGITNTLVMGPWFHGGWARSEGDLLGDIRFGSKTSHYYQEQVELPFFNCLLKDKCDRTLAEAIVFETGSNQWRQYNSWPPANVEQKQLYLHRRGGLSFRPSPSGSDVFDEYVSDPAKPVPFINGTAIGMTREYMVEDQRFASRRTDVLTYQTDPLLQTVTFAGPVKVTLYISSTGSDADYIVKLIDVYPNDAPDNEPNPANVRMGGYQMLVRGEPMRARFRNSFEKPEPLTPNRVTKIEFTMPDVNHAFLRGHRIMIQVQSSWFPLVDRNPQKFVNIYQATTEDFQKATQRVYRAGAQASHLTINVLK